MCRVIKSYGRLAQLVEHLLDVQVVSGSNPLTSTTICDIQIAIVNGLLILEICL